MKWKVVLYKFLANLFKVLKGTDEMLDCCELSLLEKLKNKTILCPFPLPFLSQHDHALGPHKSQFL